MKARRIILTIALFLVLSALGLSVDNPNVDTPGTRNPAASGTVGSGTVPVSSYRSGLHRTPNPIDRTSDLVVTGNVTGGREFRGHVPYNAVTNFGGRLGSGTLDSFMRYSSGPANYDFYGTKPIPFYSQTATVTSIRPGFPDVFRPPTSLIDNGASSVFGTIFIPRNQSYLESGLTISMGRIRPISMSTSEAERLLMLEPQYRLREAGELKSEARTVPGRYNRLLGVDPAKEGALGTKLQELETTLGQTTLKYDPELIKVQQQEQIENIRQDKAVQTAKETAGELGGFDVYDQMKQKAYGDYGLYEAKQPVPDKGEDEKTIKSDRLIMDEKGEKRIETVETKEPPLTDYQKAAGAREIIGPFKSFATYSDDRFNHHMREAESRLKKGEYYLADNSYSMAGIYKSADPLVYAGRCHSLFMAGEYISSAFFLSRAIYIFPKYAKMQIDIVSLIGDRDKIETRLAKVEEVLKGRDVAELRFAAAYFYYHLGRIDMAKAHIEAVYEKLPDMSGVKELKGAIDEAAGK